MKIDIKVNDIQLQARLLANPSAEKIKTVLPLEGRSHVWGEEIYFEIPVQAEQEADAVEEVTVGTLAYWPPGQALCIFFGPTPVSTGDAPRAYSAVNIVGEVIGDPRALKTISEGDLIRIEKTDG